VRNCYGVGGLGHQPVGRLCLRYAWPSASWGSLPLEGGIEAAYRAEIDASDDPQAKLEEIEERLNRLRSPFRTAESFWIDEVIDPRETRRLLCDFATMAPTRTWAIQIRHASVSPTTWAAPGRGERQGSVQVARNSIAGMAG
jgi:acetyl-CoA carboxylase carboxyltransferase component